MKGKTGYLRGFASFLRGFASYGLTIIGYLCNRTRTMLGRMKTAPCCKEALEGRKMNGIVIKKKEHKAKQNLNQT